MKSLSQLFSDISNARKAMQQVVDSAPRIIGVEAVKCIKENFQKQGYDSGFGFTAWVKRKPETNKSYDHGRTVNSKTGKLSKYRTGKNGTYKGSVYSSSNPILDQTGNLKNSVAYKASRRRVFVGVNLAIIPYAKAHNQGEHHEPKRQFMPLPGENANPKILAASRKQIDYLAQKAMRAFKR